MLGDLAVRERSCPACTQVVRDRRARWCGTCGEALAPPREAPPATTPPRRLLIALVVGVALVAAVATGGGLVDRAAGSAAVEDLAVASPDDDALDRLARRPAPPPPTVSAPTCTQVRDDSCFLWVAEATGLDFSAATVTDELLLTLDGVLAARDLDDGSIVWSAEVEDGATDHAVPVVDDLLVHAAGGDLRARDLATGRERWRTDALGRVVPHTVARAGEVLLITGEVRGGHGYPTEPPPVFAAGLDVASGEVRWLEEAPGASLAAGGTVVLTTGDGGLRALGADGVERWEVGGVVDVDAGGGAWAAGHLISVYDDRDGSRTYRLADGAELPLQGYVLTSDDDHSFVEVYDEVDEDEFEHHSEFALLDAHGEVWRVEGRDWDNCLRRALLEPTTVELDTCGGHRISLDRGDGSQRSRRPPPPGVTSIHGDGSEVVGPYGFLHETTDEGYLGDLVVTDRRTDTEIARLPADTHQLSRHGPWWEPDLGGVTVLQSRGWLVAFALPSPGTDAGPPAAR